MMIYQIFSRYYRLSLDGKVPPLLCGADRTHEQPLVPNMTDDERIYLYCLQCEYRRWAGISLYENLRELVEKAGKEDGRA